MTVAHARLFRPEVVAACTDTCGRGGANPLSLSCRILSLLSVLLVVTIAALLYHGEYAGRHSVRGHITTTEANIRILARQAGIVTRIDVSEGAVVRRGDPLLRIEDPRHTSGTNVNAALRESLQAGLQRLAQEALTAKQLAANETDAVNQAARNAAGQLTATQREQQLAKSRYELARDHYQRLLSAGAAVSVHRRQQAQAAMLSADARQASLRRQSLQHRVAVDGADKAARKIELQLSSRLAEIAVRREALQQQMIRAAATADSSMLAPVTGQVSAVVVRPGTPVSAQQPLLTLLPTTARYVVDLVVPDRAAGQLRIGDPVRLRVDAFPYQHFGILRGTVSSVSAATVESNNAVPAATRDLRGFLVRVALPQAALPLRAGMMVTADVLQEKRRLLGWLLGALCGAGARLSP